MIVRKFIHWSQNASASARADGVGALARAYLYSDLSEEERGEAEQTLYALMDDPSPLVRRALAESLASAAEAPPAIMLGLACDQSDISTVVLGRSPLLSDAQLIDCAAIGDSAAQAAIALRPELSATVAAALAEVASREALIALAVNEGANLPDFAMRRIIERFGADGEMREALLGRSWLPGEVRAALANAAARQLADHAVQRNWLSRARSERLAQDSRDRATMIIAAGCASYSDETAALAAYLRVTGQLTAGLALRALLCGQTGLFEATLVELTGMGPRRVAGLIRDPNSNAFAALYAKAGLPAPLMLAFSTALSALSHHQTDADDGALRLPVIHAVLARCEAAGEEAFGRLIALLRRFEGDAAREIGRRNMERMQREAPAPADAPTVETYQAPQFVSTPVAQAAPVAQVAPIPDVAPLEQKPLAADDDEIGFAPGVAPVSAMDEDIEIFIDFNALEKELIAA